MAQQWPQFGKTSMDLGEMAEKARKEVEDLRHEARRDRRLTSEVISDLINHCQENKKNDPLINGQLNEPGGNPFLAKKACCIL